MNDNTRKSLRGIGAVFIAIFVGGLFTGHGSGPIETFKAHLSGQYPIPWWSYGLLIAGILGVILGRRRKG